MSLPRLYEHYKTAVRDQLKDAFDYKNPNQIPRWEKVVLNMGVGEATQTGRDRRAVDDMTRFPARSRS